MMVNPLNIDIPNAPPVQLKLLDKSNDWIKVSLFLQSLDLAGFDDFEIWLDVELEALRCHQLELHKNVYSSMWIQHKRRLAGSDPDNLVVIATFSVQSQPSS